jgi:intein/homing endonuclease
MDDGTKIRRTDDDEFIPSFAENVDVKITSNCRIGCNFCLTGDTLIETSNGPKKISEIEKGDIVYSFNCLNNEFQLKPVDMTFCRVYEGDLIEIEIEDGSSIKCTPNHKLYTINRGWIKAENLTENDDILIF